MLTAEEYITGHWIPKQVWTHLEWPKHQQRFRDVIQYLKGITYCDVGCACGHSTVIMDQLNGNLGKWTGVDFSLTAIKEAVQRFPNYTWKYAPYPEDVVLTGVYDSIVCSEVIEHADDPSRLVKGLLAATNSGGRVIITTPNKHVNDPGHMRVYTEDDLAVLLDGLRYTLKVHQQVFWYIVIDKEESMDGHI